MVRLSSYAIEEVCIVAGDYETTNPPLLRYFCRNRQGKSVLVLCNTFLPYFHYIGNSKVYRESQYFVGEDKCRLKIGQRTKSATKITLDSPWKVPEVRDMLEKRDGTCYSADVLFHLRYLWDKGAGMCNRVVGRPDAAMAKQYDVDRAIWVEEGNDDHGWERIEPFIPPLTVLSLDIENSLRDGVIYCIGLIWRVGSAPLQRKMITASSDTVVVGRLSRYSEHELGTYSILDQLEHWLETINPDIITGYNVGYDIDQIDTHAKKYRGRSKPFIGSRVGKPFRKSRSGEYWEAGGRVIIDGWRAAKDQLKPARETLSFVSELLGIGEKDPINTAKIEKEWAERPEEVAIYCQKDADLALAVIDHPKLRSVDRCFLLGSVAGLPAADIATGITSRWIDGALVPQADRMGYAVPVGKVSQTGRRIVGGHVLDPTPGITPWVVTVDYASMYPSIIMDRNICFTTKVAPKSVEKEKVNISPIGAWFLKQEGLIPRTMRRFLKDRKEAKRKRDQHEKGSDSYYFYDELQNAIKIYMNAFFGVFGSNFYRFTDKDIGESITTWARKNIKEVIVSIEKQGLKLIYGDTDSCFIKVPEKIEGDIPKMIEFGEDLAARYSRPGAILEFEKLFSRLLMTDVKKRYAGLTAWPTAGDFYTRGFETRRTDGFQFLREVLQNVFDMLLHDRIDDGIQYARDSIKLLTNGDISFRNLIISKRCNKIEGYKNPDTLPQVQAARKAAKRGHTFIPGMKVSYVVTNSSVTPQEVEPFFDGMKGILAPDLTYYSDRLVRALAKVLAPFGWGEQDLKVGAKQVSLEDYLTW